MTRRQLAVGLPLLFLGAVGLGWGAVALGAVDPSATTRPSRLEKVVAHAALDAAVSPCAPEAR